MTSDLNDRFPGEVDVGKRRVIAREIANIALSASQLTDDFSNVERIPRLSDSRRENDVEHSFMLEVAAPAIAGRFYPHLNKDKVRRFAHVHDMIEIVVGDVATFDLSDAELKEKERREREAKVVVLERLNEIDPTLAEDLEEYERQDCPEAIFVRMVDKLLPSAVDISGDGLRIMREDFGVNDLATLEISHNQLFARMQETFGAEYPDLVAAHALLALDFEEKYKASPSEMLEVKESVRGPVETELKFLIDELPEDIDLENTAHTVLRQGYVMVSNDGAETRIRSFDNERFELTVKSAGTNQRSEQTIILSQDMFDALWAQTDGKRVEKTRYNIPFGKYVIELDMYEGRLAGLMTAEVEFAGRQEDAEVRAAMFEPPEWFGRNVTNDKRYKNQNLASGLPHEPFDLGSMQL